MPPTLKAAGLTDVGRRREHNEDHILVDEELGLFAVADGMGGHAAGEVASHTAIDTIHDFLLRARNGRPHPEPAERLRLIDAFLGEQPDHPRKKELLWLKAEICLLYTSPSPRDA